MLAPLRLTFCIVVPDWPMTRAGLSSDRHPGYFPQSDKTSIADFVGIFEWSVGVVSVDSFAAHVGLAYSRTVAVLMVEPYSQQRSYPENNPHLMLFPARDGVERAIARFFATHFLVS
jgi:ADP-heptose:LPS heptosyltransferase